MKRVEVLGGRLCLSGHGLVKKVKVVKMSKVKTVKAGNVDLVELLEDKREQNLDLCKKIAAIDVLLGDNSLSSDDFDLLLKQMDAMVIYSDSLGKRIDKLVSVVNQFAVDVVLV
jgi:hypothetical protein